MAVGINSRLDTLQAAILNVKLARLEQWALSRRKNAARYVSLCEAAGLGERIALPTVARHCESVWNQYTIRVRSGDRDRLQSFLTDQGIGSAIYYPVPLHLQPCFASLGYKPGSLPETERACREVLSLPIYPELDASEQSTVVAALGEYFAREAREGGSEPVQTYPLSQDAAVRMAS